MRLDRGTTGFQHVDDPPLPDVDSQSFTRHIFDIARAANASVVHKPYCNPRVDCNFFDALLEFAGERIRVLLNITYPLVAFTEERNRIGPPLPFLDHDELAEAFSQFPLYTVLSVTTLEQPVDEQMIAGLAKVEIDQIEYWKPTRLGDVIFNFWD